MTLSSQCCNRCSAFFRPVSRTQSLCEGCSPRSTPPPVHAGVSQETSAPPEREGVPIPAGVLGQRRAPDVALLDFLAGKTGVPHVSASGEITLKRVHEVDLATLPGVYVALEFESCGYSFSFPRVRLEENPGPGISYQLFGDGAPLATRAPLDPAYQGGLHRWPLDLAAGGGLHGSPEEP